VSLRMCVCACVSAYVSVYQCTYVGVHECECLSKHAFVRVCIFYTIMCTSTILSECVQLIAVHTYVP
jgi:hypothetical protein